MNLVDSCGWLEYFSDGSNADFFAPAIENTQKLIVPTICLLEVFKKVLQQRSEQEALQTIALMKQGEIIDLDAELALEAARISHQLKLPLADAVILTSAKAHQALVWTQDADFQNLENVRFVKK